MVLYKKTNITAKKGINFVRSAVEITGSLFHKIEGENDLGIDALIELIRDEKPLNRQVAVQIRSGSSYYNATGKECLIPISSHREYWLYHPLPVLGIVYVPTLDRAHWIDIKSYLKEHSDRSVIRFQTSETNRFDSSTFCRLFVPTILCEILDLTLHEALQLFQSAKPDESYLGLITIFRRYPNVCDVWDQMVRYFMERPLEEIPEILIYFLSHIPWHSDIWYKGEAITEETRLHARKLFAHFDRKVVVKLLAFIDEERAISRGTVGQSVEAIISSLPCANQYLEDVISDIDLEPFMRDCAATILAMNEGTSAIPSLNRLVGTGSWYAQELIDHIKRYGEVNPYA